jgi:hypothetical protein
MVDDFLHHLRIGEIMPSPSICFDRYLIRDFVVANLIIYNWLWHPTLTPATSSLLYWNIASITWGEAVFMIQAFARNWLITDLVIHYVSLVCFTVMPIFFVQAFRMGLYGALHCFEIFNGQTKYISSHNQLTSSCCHGLVFRLAFAIHWSIGSS